jgi:diguanylate cyclase (GGDEF)-like protein
MTARSPAADADVTPWWRSWIVAGLAVVASGVEVAFVGFGPGAGWLLVHLPVVLLAVAIGRPGLVGVVVVVACLPLVRVTFDSPAVLGAILARPIVLGAVGCLGLFWRRAAGAVQVARERDPLTGLLNNPGFRRRVEEECGRLDRGGGAFTLLVLDLDGFKRLNDTRGHVVGDRCLRHFAETLDTTTRRYDLVGRLGGDEFAVLLPNTNEAQAETAIARLRTVLVDALAGRGWVVSFSLGAVTFDVPPESVDAALAEADRRMYAAKRLVEELVEEPSDHRGA